MARRQNVRAAATLASAVHSATRPGTPGMLQRLRAVPRLVRAVRSGEYTGLSTTQLALLGAGLGYILSPIDVVPEGLLLVVGLVDDAMVLSWVALTLVRETEEFIEWERARRVAPGAEPRRSAPHAAAAQTVRSHVVPD